MMKKLAIVSLMTVLFLPVTVSAEINGFQDFSGKTVNFEKQKGKGKWLVVMMWASDCRVCNREAHQYVDFHTFHADKDASVLGVSIDGESKKAAAQGFINKHNINFPNLITEPETAARLYYESTGEQFSGTPTFMVYSPAGELKAAQAGAVPAELIEDFIEKNAVKKTVKNN